MLSTRRAIFTCLGAIAVFAIDAHFTIAPVSPEVVFDRAVAKLRERGEPTTLADLAPPPIPDEKNAAVALHEATQWRWDTGVRFGTYLATPGKWTEEDRSMVREQVRSLAPFYRGLEEVAARPQWRELWDWTENPFRQRALLLGLHDSLNPLRARVYSAREDELTDIFVSTAGLVDRIEPNLPFTWGYYVSLGWKSEPARWLHAVANRPGLDAARLRPVLEPMLARASADRGPPATLFRQERVWIIAMWRDWIDSPQGREERYAQIGKWLSALRSIEEVLKSGEVDPARAVARSRELESSASTWDGAFAPFRAYAEQAARVRLARVALALLAYEQTRGAWPESLSALAPMFPDGVPTDPYTDSPFVYRRESDGVLLAAAQPEEEASERIEHRLVWHLD